MNKQTGYFTGKIGSIDQIRQMKPKTIYYGANTLWWTHRQSDLCQNGMGLPCDPRGGMLFQTDDVEDFLKSAEENEKHYGKHGLAAFLASHNDNMVVSIEDQRSTCFADWDQYNEVLDRQYVDQSIQSDWKEE